MGIATAAVSAASFGLSVYGAVEQHNAAKKQAEASRSQAAEQRAQAAAEQRIADIKNSRERAQIAREAAITRGRIEAAGASSNSSLSSGVAGGLASVSTQEASATGIFNSIGLNQTDITNSRIRQAGDIASGAAAQVQYAQGQAFYSIGSDIFKATGGFKTIFDAARK